MSNEQGICFSTREFDTCQTKGCCSRVQDFRRRDMSKALRGFLICSLLKSERRIEDGVLDRAQPESLNFLLHAKYLKKKKTCAIGEIYIFTCFGPVLYEGSMEGV